MLPLQSGHHFGWRWLYSSSLLRLWKFFPWRMSALRRRFRRMSAFDCWDGWLGVWALSCPRTWTDEKFDSAINSIFNFLSKTQKCRDQETGVRHRRYSWNLRIHRQRRSTDEFCSQQHLSVTTRYPWWSVTSGVNVCSGLFGSARIWSDCRRASVLLLHHLYQIVVTAPSSPPSPYRNQVSRHRDGIAQCLQRNEGQRKAET